LAWLDGRQIPDGIPGRKESHHVFHRYCAVRNELAYAAPAMGRAGEAHSAGDSEVRSEGDHDEAPSHLRRSVLGCEQFGERGFVAYLAQGSGDQFKRPTALEGQQSRDVLDDDALRLQFTRDAKQRPK